MWLLGRGERKDRRSFIRLVCGASVYALVPLSAQAAEALTIRAGVVSRSGNKVRVRVRIIVHWSGVSFDQVLGIYEVAIGATKRIEKTIFGIGVKCAIVAAAAAVVVTVTLLAAMAEISKRVSVAVPAG